MIDNVLHFLLPATRSKVARIGVILAGIVFLAIASRIAVPMVPVPITLQTFAVTMIGALFGWRFGSLTIILWLTAGAVGLPVFAGNEAGLQKFLGPTAGYLFAFPFAAIAVGKLVENGWNGRHGFACFCAMLIGNALCLGIGAGWLAMKIGIYKAVMGGVLPFLIGAVLKSALAAAVMTAFARLSRRQA